MSCNQSSLMHTSTSSSSHHVPATPAVAVTPTPNQSGVLLRDAETPVPSIETHAFQTYQPPCAAHQYSMEMNKRVEFVYNPDGSILVDNNNKLVTIDKILATKPLRHELSSRPGPGNRKLTYLSGEGVTRTLNDIFGYDGWNLDIKSTKREECMKDDKDRYHIAYTAHVRVTHRRTGAYKEDCGAGDAIDRSLGTAVANALKASITDAMKRAARHFGDKLGNSLYSGSFNMNKAPTTLQQALDQHEIQRANSKFGFPKDRPQTTTAPQSQATNPMPATPAPNSIPKTPAVRAPATNVTAPSVTKAPVSATSTIQNPNTHHSVSSNTNSTTIANRPPVPQFHATGDTVSSSNTSIPRPEPRPSSARQPPANNTKTRTATVNSNISNSRISYPGHDQAAPLRTTANTSQPPLSAKQRLESGGLFAQYALENRHSPPHTTNNTVSESNQSVGADSGHDEFANMFDSIPPRPGTSSGPQCGKRPANNPRELQEPRKKQNPYLNQSSSM